ncbi:MAG TPA: cysteine desulfurase family protein [Verrucomicrobiales bacterium]|nr:cysteine desulfurase family protein [Verrucomicrobiales bacterium]
MSVSFAYFDHHATTPLCLEAREAWLRAHSEAWMNPSSLYPSAGRSRRLLEEAREECAELLGCEPARIVFTSGATEGNNAVLRWAASRGGRAVLSAVEHPAVREPAWQFFGDGGVCELPVDEKGVVLADVLRAELETPGTKPAVVSVMAANNETGVLQAWRETAARCAEHGVPYHCDAAQWIGKRPAAGLAECAWVTLSAHKFGGPKGVGVLIIPAGTFSPLRLRAGGPQESGHRAGTEDYPGVAAMAAALAARAGWAADEQARAKASAWRDAFESRLMKHLPGTQVVGSGALRSETVSMVIVPRHPQLKWVTRLGERGFCVSTGSACSSGKGNPSPVLQAMGIDAEAMGRALRFSAGPETVEADWEGLLEALLDVWEVLESGVRDRPKVDLSRL